MKKWPGVLKILEICHMRGPEVIWSQSNIYNQLHSEGEALLLSCCFNNTGTLPPNAYYFGLDNRGTINAGDTLEDIFGEPSSNGYNRQARPSNGGFTIELVNGMYRASSSIMTFSASGGAWGPVKNIFMTNAAGSSGTLISSAALSQEVSLISGDSVNLRMALSLS